MAVSNRRYEVIYGKGLNDPVFFAEKVLGMRLHKGQKEYLMNFKDKQHYILCPSNQWGKSVIVAVAHIWAAFYKFKFPNWEYEKWNNQDFWNLPYHSLNISPRLRQARQVYAYILDILQGRFVWQEEKWVESYGDRSKFWRRIFKKNKLAEDVIGDFLVKPLNVPGDNSLASMPIKFKNNSEIHIASTRNDKGSGLAGDQFPLITYDECALTDHLEEELGNYIYSRLIKYEGSLHLISTPDSDSESYEYFRSLVDKAEERKEWGLQIGTLLDNEFLPKKQVKKMESEMRELDPDMYRQVFYGEFVGGRGRFFRPREVERMFKDKWELEEPKPAHRYVIGADFAIAQNYTVYVVMDVSEEDDWYLVHFVRFKGSKYSPQYQTTLLSQLAKDYNNAEVVIDSSSLAGPFIQGQLDLTLNVYENKFDSARKKELLVALKKALSFEDRGKIHVPTPTKKNGLFALRQEMHNYREKDRRKVKDCVMSLGLVAWRMDEFEREGEVKPFTFDPLAIYA